VKVVSISILLTTAPVRAQEPVYQAELLRFSEVVGAVSYLDRLCGGAGGYWRQSMEQLLKAQGLAGPERRPYVQAFNRGERTFSVVHTICTDRARTILTHYMDEGQALAERITARFGGDPPSATSAQRLGLPQN
jgi:uncharacterized protein (TIGR02301 family)